MNEEIFTILGARVYSFKDDKTGNVIEGVTLHTVNSNPCEKGVYGSLVEKISVSNETIKDVLLSIGSTDLGDIVGVNVEPTYNKRGKVRHLDVVQSDE